MTMLNLKHEKEATNAQPLKPKKLIGVVKNLAVIMSCLSAGVGIAAHGIAYWRAEQVKIRNQERIEMRLVSVEEKARHTEEILSQLDVRFVPRREVEEREKRELQNYQRIEHLERMMENIDGAVTRLVSSPAVHH